MSTKPPRRGAVLGFQRRYWVPRRLIPTMGFQPTPCFKASATSKSLNFKFDSVMIYSTILKWYREEIRIMFFDNNLCRIRLLLFCCF
ncbi:hypothetical protein TanjilG_26724 [Lupinus angustifolius]|uniref:Uncharacterized protein n=1 Tax=Lupinus angustifolius TaxID=3871 RepID=A0A1J7HRC6_LUPAN|nr:hypothetical protein TanjilG_26724 [Lupinus angustifolius]